MPDLPAPLRAEALYKLGVISAELERKPEAAREYWERAVAADPACRYGRMAQRRLQAHPRSDARDGRRGPDDRFLRPEAGDPAIRRRSSRSGGQRARSECPDG